MIIVPGASAGDIEGVTAGDGLSGTATSGTASLAVDLATNSGLEFDSNKLSIAKGVSQHDVAQFAAGVDDNDFLKVDGTTIEGRSASEVLSDIGAGAAAGSSSIVTTGALDAGSITSNFGTINNGASAITTTGTVSGGIVDVATELHFDSTPADGAVSGITATFTAGEALALGEVVYLKAADSKMYKAVSGAGGTGLISPDIMCKAIVAQSTISADATGKFLLKGFIHAATNFPTYTVGETLYVPEAETSSQNVPEGAIPDSDGDFVQVIGLAFTGDIIYFDPDYTIIEHA